MPTETWGNILFQAQLALRELATTGATTRSPEQLMHLADQVDRIHGDEHFRVTTLHEPPRVIRWEEPDLQQEGKPA